MKITKIQVEALAEAKTAGKKKILAVAGIEIEGVLWIHKYEIRTDDRGTVSVAWNPGVKAQTIAERQRIDHLLIAQYRWKYGTDEEFAEASRKMEHRDIKLIY